MSVAARLISGSLASWVQIAINMATQLVLVPIYLNYWDVKTYGVWLAIQSIVTVLSMLDMGHQNYMGFELLRLGRNNLLAFSKSLWSAIVIGFVLSLVQLVVMGILFVTGTLTFLIGESGSTDHELIKAAGYASILMIFTWAVGVSLPGYIARALAPFGYFPRMLWWGVLYLIVGALSPLIAVILGADLLIATAAAAAGCLACNIPLYVDMYKLLKRERVRLVKPSMALGYHNFRMSLPLLGKSIFENVRQQGVRLLVAPFAGPVGLAAFSTMRTGANVALQGLNTIVNPILPDLMRFLHERDQARSEAAFSTVWIVVVAIMAPAVVILQAFVEPLYVFWTQGKINFDPLLFSILSLGVLVYAVTQPAMAIVMGNNLAKKQLILAAISAAVVAGFLCLLVPFIGILGAAIALLLAEIVAGYGYLIFAVRWLNENDLMWPKRLFSLAVVSVGIATVALFCLVWLPELKWLVIMISLIFFGWNLLRYWKVLPAIAVQNAKNVIVKIPGMNKIFYLLMALRRNVGQLKQ